MNESSKFHILTESERQILLMVREGLTSKEIAVVRSCSVRTVEKHRSNIIKKLDLKGRSHGLIYMNIMDDSFKKKYNL